MWKTIYGHGRIGFIDEPPVVVNHAAQMGAIDVLFSDHPKCMDLIFI